MRAADPVVTGPRSARAVLGSAALLLCALPLLLLLVAYVYEGVIVHRYHARLLEVAKRIAADGSQAMAPIARREGVEVRLISASGQVLADSQSDDSAVVPSLVGGLAERLLPGEEASGSEHLSAVDLHLGPTAQRQEVRNAMGGTADFAVRASPLGQMTVFSLALPHRGGVIYVMKASRRGVRRLLLLRRELLKLVLYQVPFALLFALLLGRRLVRPLERLARAARRYPAQPLSDPTLLARRDEIGALCRALTAMADDLEQRRQATADLGADIVHEFKNPLATIAASAEYIVPGPTAGPISAAASAEKNRLAAELILQSVGRLTQSLDALLALLRLEATLPGEPRTSCDYAALVESVVAEFRRDPRHAGRRIDAVIEPAVGQVDLVTGRWAELLRNLIDNALYQPSDGREVQVRVERVANQLITTVRDFGPGIAVGNRDKIFRRFFSQRPAGVPPGTGLGLSIVKAVAQAHGGTVEVSSASSPHGEGAQGAAFRVVLPLPPP